MVGVTKRKVQENKKLLENLQESGKRKTGPLLEEVEKKFRKQVSDAYYLDTQWRSTLWRSSLVMIAVMAYKIYEKYKVPGSSSLGTSTGLGLQSGMNITTNDNGNNGNSPPLNFVVLNEFEILNIVVGLFGVKFIGTAQASIYQQRHFYLAIGIIFFQFYQFFISVYSLYDEYQKASEQQGLEQVEEEGIAKDAWHQLVTFFRTEFPIGGFYYLFLIGCDLIMKSIIHNANENLRKSSELGSKIH